NISSSLFFGKKSLAYLFLKFLAADLDHPKSNWIFQLKKTQCPLDIFGLDLFLIFLYVR
ncbi:hypothetical protein ACJX0J_005875, partial [Zea mays]